MEATGMGVKVSAADAAANWGTGFGAAGPKYTAGINAVTVAPGVAASQNVQGYLAGVQASSKIWQAKMAAQDLSQWKAAAAGVGAQRLATGATKGQAKIQQFFQQFIPDLTNIVGSLPQRGTYEQNMARSRAFADALHAKKGQY
jgi:hypothetical protein